MRKGKRYWGPALIVLGLIAGSVAVAMVRGDALAWTLAACAVVVLAGITLVAAARQGV